MYKYFWVKQYPRICHKLQGFNKATSQSLSERVKVTYMHNKVPCLQLEFFFFTYSAVDKTDMTMSEIIQNPLFYLDLNFEFD